MSARDFTKILIKVAGLWLLVQCVLQLGTTLGSFISLRGQDDASWWMYLLAAIPVLIQVVVGLLMMALPGAITDTLLEKSVTTPVPPAALAQQIEEAAIGVLAVYLFFRGLVDVSYWFSHFGLFTLALDKQGMFTGPRMTPDMFGNLISTGAEVVFAIILFFGARGLVRLRDRVRGHPYEPAPSQEASND